MAVSYMTKDGYDKILAEINYLETVKRPEISAQIAEARDKGDLSENAEYDAAKEAQGIMEAKLSQLKGLISNARLIDETRVQTDEVQILHKEQCSHDVYSGLRFGSKPERRQDCGQYSDCAGADGKKGR